LLLKIKKSNRIAGRVYEVVLHHQVITEKTDLEWSSGLPDLHVALIVEEFIENVVVYSGDIEGEV
jgi:hypothetical protein